MASSPQQVSHGDDDRQKNFQLKPQETWDLYDPHAHRDHTLETNLFESTANLVIGCIGGGILSVPFGFMKVGIWVGFFMNMIFGVLVGYSIYIVVAASQVLCHRVHVPKLTYVELCEAAFATAPCRKIQRWDKAFRRSMEFIMCVDIVGVCAVYVIIMASTIKQLAEDRQIITMEASGASPNIRVYMLIVMPFLILLCLIRSMKYLSKFSFVAICSIGLCLGTTAYFAFESPTPLKDVPGYKGLIPLLEFTGISIFSMEGIGICLAVENVMKEPHKYIYVNIVGCIIITTVVSLMGFFGYWAFGEDCQGAITLNFPLMPFTFVVKVMLAFVIYVAFAVNLWTPFNVMWHYLKRFHQPSQHWFFERVWRSILVIVIVLLAIAFPNIGNFAGLLGSLCYSFMLFLHMAVIDTVVFWAIPGMGKCRVRLIKNILLFTFGLALMIFGTIQNGYEMFSNIQQNKLS